MTEQEKCKKGLLYDANYDLEIVNKRLKCADLCFELNHCKPSDIETQKKIVKQLLGKVKGDFFITTLFYCDYGDNFYANHNCVITTAGHPLDFLKRAQGLEFAHPIVVEAGSIVTKNIFPYVVAYGNLCQVQKRLIEDEA